MSIRSRLIVMLILVSALSSVVLIYIGYQNGKAAISHSVFNQMNSIKSAKKYQIESYFKEMASVTEVLGANETVKNALKDFKNGFRKIGENSLNIECSKQLSDHYTEFVDRLTQNMDVKNNPELYYPNTAEACYLQYEYIIDNPNPAGEKYLMDDARDESEYSIAHKRYHKYLTEIILKFGFYDAFLIDLEYGDIVYSVYKETDYATNLYTGPYRESNLAELVRKLKSNADISKATFVDFKNYRPSYGAPAAFVGIPITEGLETIGALVFQLPVGEINKIMTGNENWEADGLGESGETYLVGEDFKMRSLSRFFKQDTVGFTQSLLKLGVPQEDVDKMYRIGTTILTQKVKTEGVIAALSGKEETKVIEDYRFVPVLSSYAPLHLPDLNWVILSEMDEAEANASIKDFEKKVFIALCIIILVVTFMAMFLAGRFVQPIEKLTEGVRRLSNGDYSTPIDIQSKDEFGELATSFNEMILSIDEQQNTITRQQQENKELLLNFIPPMIVKRLQEGEKNIVDNYPNISLIAFRLDGFAALSKKIGAAESSSLLNHLIEVFDDAAEQNQVEKIRTINGTYFAVCGMFSPRLDHAKKIFEFAIQVRQLLGQFNTNYNLDMSLHLGVHSGEVFAGLVGEKNYNFDLWGECISEVFDILEIKKDNAIFVTKPVYDKIQDLYDFSQHPSMNEISIWEYQFVKKNH